ncbi:MAG: ABC transporter ATP-binding protein [Nitriliruptoraceae bacterium]
MGSTDDQTVLSCRGLTKTYGQLCAVDDVSLTIMRGQTYGLLGPNGAGKTTTISMIAGLLTPDTGSITVAGEATGPSRRAAKKHVGLVPQELAIYPDLSARENLAFFAKLHGMGRDVIARRIGEVLEIIGLTDRADDRAGTYSGGMKRRLNIGIGLLHRPQLLILDEPTVGVDPQSRNAILESVEVLAVEGMSVLYTTHYMEEAERLCDRIGIVDQGRIVAEGSRSELTRLVGEQTAVRVELAGDVTAAVAACRVIAGVDSADADGATMTVLGDNGTVILPAVLAAVSQVNASVTGVDVRQPNLEDVFLHLTGKALRD